MKKLITIENASELKVGDLLLMIRRVSNPDSADSIPFNRRSMGQVTSIEVREGFYYVGFKGRHDLSNKCTGSCTFGYTRIEDQSDYKYILYHIVVGHEPVRSMHWPAELPNLKGNPAYDLMM